MQYRRHPGPGAGGHIGRTADDNPGDGQATEEPGQHIRAALPDHFPIEVGARPLVQLVDTDRAQQRFDAGDQGDGEDADGDHADLLSPRSAAGGHVGDIRQANRLEKVAGQGNSLDVQSGDLCERGRRHDGHQSARNYPRLGRKLRPQQQDGDDGASDDHLVQFVMQDAVGQCHDVLPRRTPGRPTHQHVNLLQRDGDADARQHGVHHHRSNGKGRAGHPAHAERDLQRTCSDGHHAQHRPADLVDQPGDHHGQTRGWSAHLNRRPADGPGDNATYHRGDQTGGQRGARGDRDPQRQRQRDQKDDERRRNVVPQVNQDPP